MERTRARDWVIARLAIRTVPTGFTRRRGQLLQVDWDEVDGLALTESQQGTDAVLAMLSELRPADVATALADMPAKRRLEIATALDDERLADVLQEMSEDEQVELVRQLADERAADVLGAMDDDDAADLLGDMPTADQQRLLELMEPAEAEPVRRLMTYADYTAGGLMTTEPVIMPPDATVAEALASIRNPELSPAVAAQVYVVRPPQATPTGRFLGTAHVQRLLREPPSELVSGVCVKDTGALRPDASIEDVTKHLATYNLVAVPVVDEHERLLGAVSVDDVLDHLLPENWRDERDFAPGEPWLSRVRAWTSPARRGAGRSCTSTPRRSGRSPRRSRGFWAPAATWRSRRSS